MPHLFALSRRVPVALALAAMASLALAQTVAPVPKPTEAAKAAPAASAPRPPLPANTLNAVRARGKLRVGITTYPPWVMRGKDGQLAGFSIDVARQLGEDLGVEVEFVETNYIDLLPDLVEGASDVVISGVSATPDRALFANFTTPLASHEIWLAANKQAAGAWKTVADFDKPEVAIGAMQGSAAAATARRVFPKAKVQVFSSEAEMGGALLEGKVAAVAATSPVPDIFVKVVPGDKVSLPLDKAIGRRAEAMAVRRGDDDFLHYLNTWIQAYSYAGWLDERSRYWLKELTWVESMK